MARRPTFPSSTASTTTRCSVPDRRCHVVMGRSGATPTIMPSSSISYVRSYAGLENAGRQIVTDTTRRCRLCGVMHMKHDLCCTDTLSWMPWNPRLVTTWWSCQPSGLMPSPQMLYSPRESSSTVSTILVGGCSWAMMLVLQRLSCRPSSSEAAHVAEYAILCERPHSDVNPESSASGLERRALPMTLTKRICKLREALKLLSQSRGREPTATSSTPAPPSTL